MTELTVARTDVEQSANAIREAFSEYGTSFREITRRAKGRFDRREWQQVHADAEQRLDLYKNVVDKIVSRLIQDLGARGADGEFWAAVKERYTRLIAERGDFDLAESFYNSVTMRMVASRGIEPAIEYMGTEFPVPTHGGLDQIYVAYQAKAGTKELIRQLLEDYRFEADYWDLQQTAWRVATEIEATLLGQTVELMEIAKPVFYRGKAAYLVGRLLTGAGYTPLVLALMNDEEGVDVDAVLMTEDEVSIIFSFARSYFHVEVEKPYALVHFLKEIMPLKPIAELYISLGYNKHGKTELYRDLRRHLAVSSDRFEIAPGERGMVMVVFTLPSYDVVFKVIKDSFDYPKVTTRREVQNHYQLVFKHDRGGRLVDAQEFEHLRFDKDRFSPALLDELLQVAGNSVVVDGDTVEIRHLYTERRLIPLNLYLHEVGPQEATEAVNDYGQAIKDLAATNIFPGDILLKNFGVTRHGRVVFYDYDELCLLTDCNFREMPTTHDPDEAVSSEPWFFVDENDVFPEELATFLGLPPPLREVFTCSNAELFGVDFWTELQARHRAGEVIDIFPYKESRRLDKEVPV